MIDTLLAHRRVRRSPSSPVRTFRRTISCSAPSATSSRCGGRSMACRRSRGRTARPRRSRRCTRAVALDADARAVEVERRRRPARSDRSRVVRRRRRRGADRDDPGCYTRAAVTLADLAGDSAAASRATARSRSRASPASTTPVPATSPSSPIRSTRRSWPTTRASAVIADDTRRRARRARSCARASRISRLPTRSRC